MYCSYKHLKQTVFAHSVKLTNVRQERRLQGNGEHERLIYLTSYNIREVIANYCPLSYIFCCKRFLGAPYISGESWIFSR